MYVAWLLPDYYYSLLFGLPIVEEKRIVNNAYGASPEIHNIIIFNVEI